MLLGIVLVFGGSSVRLCVDSVCQPFQIRKVRTSILPPNTYKMVKMVSTIKSGRSDYPTNFTIENMLLI